MIGPMPEATDGKQLSASALALLRTHAKKIFAARGWLQSGLKLEHRPGQENMAKAVAETLCAGESLLVEAGTGIGKSLAYLLPGLMLAVESKRPFVVSTHTLSLQEQIFKKDLELCRALFRLTDELAPYADFKASVLVGRANYLCPQRLVRALQTRMDLFENAMHEELERLVAWAQKTKDGMREELQPPPHYDVWEAVCADSSACSPRTCSPKTCFYQRAKADARDANLIIVNHSLLFALLGAGAGPEEEQSGVLFPDDLVVLDEAHRVPEIASDHFGARVSSYGLERALLSLYNPKSRKGFLAKRGGTRDHALVEAAIKAGRDFFDAVREKFPERKDLLRLREAEWCPPLLDKPLAALATRLATLAESASNETEGDELRDHRRKIAAVRSSVDTCLKLAEEGHVYWIERTGQRKTIVHLRSAPRDPAPQLRESLFEPSSGLVLTSATLSDGTSMENFISRIGAPPRTRAQIEASPFDFENVMRVFAAGDAPEPTTGGGRMNLEWLADTIFFCAGRVRGGTLALFTSHADMRAVAEQIEGNWANLGRPLYLQGRDHSRGDLTRHFAKAGNGLLFGTDSFWTGVDVPGPALSQVILVRLPFENPTHPVLEARLEWVRDSGGNAFAEITLPDALVKFRQGIGRLIRRNTDCGTITILDSRVLRREYGKRFFAALPCKKHTIFTRGDRTKVFQPLEAK